MSQLTISFSVATLDGQNPPTKGSTRSFVMNGRAITTNDNPKNKSWAKVVGFKAKEFKASDSPWSGPLQLTLIFRMRILKKMPKGRTLPIVKPDLDKVTRSVLDALTGILYVDDAQIIALAASKEYAEQPGVYVELTRFLTEEGQHEQREETGAEAGKGQQNGGGRRQGRRRGSSGNAGR